MAAFILAAGIETLQLTVIPGRDASLSDLLTDTTGGAVGALLASQWRRLILPDHRTARTLCATILVAWTASRFGTALEFAEALRRACPGIEFGGDQIRFDMPGIDFKRLFQELFNVIELVHGLQDDGCPARQSIR